MGDSRIMVYEGVGGVGGAGLTLTGERVGDGEGEMSSGGCSGFVHGMATMWPTGRRLWDCVR